MIFIQETKLLAREKKALSTILSDYEVLYSNNPSNTGANATTHTAGICTAISRKISTKYAFQTIQLPPSLSGHCLVLLVSLPGTDFSLKLINLRLLTPEQNKLAVQEKMIEDLRGAISSHPTKYTILGGDFNFVERDVDTTSEFKMEKRKQWAPGSCCSRNRNSLTAPATCTPSSTRQELTNLQLLDSAPGLPGSTASTFLTRRLISRLSNR